MSAQRYFGGEIRFEVEANSKQEALEVARRSHYYEIMRGQFIENTLTCVRKLKPSFGVEYENHMKGLENGD